MVGKCSKYNGPPGTCTEDGGEKRWSHVEDEKKFVQIEYFGCGDSEEKNALNITSKTTRNVRIFACFSFSVFLSACNLRICTISKERKIGTQLLQFIC